MQVGSFKSAGFRISQRKSHRKSRRKSENRQSGYLMITLMLTIALLAIALLAVLPDIKQQITRDREDELRHRGTAYMRAIQHFYKKFGRYPGKIEELENTNNLRFLRKRYTDPMNVDKKTGKEKDFKFLTALDITLNSGPVLGQTPGQGGQPGTGQPGSGGFGTQGGLGGSPGGAGFGGSQPNGSQPNGTQAPGSGPQAAGSDASPDSASGDTSNANGSSNSNPNASPNSNPGSNSGSGFNGPTLGGGPIVGVASLNKTSKSIRVFYDKNHYNDWLFVYLPQADRGGLLTGPVSQNGPTSGGFGTGLPGQTGGLPGQPGGLPGQGQGIGAGQNQGFGAPIGGQSQPPTPGPGAGQTPPE